MTVDVTGGGRPRRFCDVCTQADDHPRHVVALHDGSTQTRHLDCCAARGCPDNSCPPLLAAVGAVRGSDLLKALQTGVNLGGK